MNSLRCFAFLMAWATALPAICAEGGASIPQVPSHRLEITQLPSGAIPMPSELPLQVDMESARQFVLLGFGAQMKDGRNFQSTQVLTPRLNTRQASQLIQLVPEYRTFKGGAVASAVSKFAGRVSGVEFGREGSPVLYFDLPYWTHQREGPVSTGQGTRVSDEENAKLVGDLRSVFVGELGAEEFGEARPSSRRIRVWWH